jgi:hypothetical protein
MNQRCDDRDGEHRLRDDHGCRREQQLQEAERSRTGKRQIENKAHHDGRQAEEGINQDDDGATAAKSENRKGCADG